MTLFAYPYVFALFILPVFLFLVIPPIKKINVDALKVPFIDDLINIKNNSKGGLKGFSFTLFSKFRLFVLFLMYFFIVVALARPQWVGEPIKIKNEGRDVLLVVDISNSMAERDFVYQNNYYDRLTAVKNVVSRFVDDRLEDRLGLVLFGTRAYLQTPLTFDKNSLKDVLWSIEPGMAGNSTSIGDAVGLALKTLATDKKKTAGKIIVLLTDGESNDGELSMSQAIDLAKKEDIKIYTIGVGNDNNEEGFFGNFFSFGNSSELDEKSLKELAKETKANYFRAKDVNSLFQVYQQINKLEAQKTEGRFIQEIKELYYYPASLSLVLFVLLLIIKKRS